MEVLITPSVPPARVACINAGLEKRMIIKLKKVGIDSDDKSLEFIDDLKQSILVANNKD